MFVLDVFDSLTTDRPYRKTLSHEEAVRIMAEEVNAIGGPRIFSEV